MAGGITGLEQLDELAARLGALAGAPARAAARAAPALLAVAQADWAAGRAPDGSPWPPTRDGRTPLTALTSQATARADGDAVVLELPDELRPHQAGSARLPRRQVVPDEGEALPPAWEKTLDTAFADEVAATLGR